MDFLLVIDPECVRTLPELVLAFRPESCGSLPAVPDDDAGYAVAEKEGPVYDEVGSDDAWPYERPGTTADAGLSAVLPVCEEPELAKGRTAEKPMSLSADIPL